MQNAINQNGCGEAVPRDKVAGWIRTLDLEPAQKLVLLIVFDHAGPQQNGEWASWAKNETISREAGWSSSATVRKRIAEMETAGIVRRDTRERPNGSQTSNLIVLLVPRHDGSAHPATVGAPPPATAVAPQKPQEEALPLMEDERQEQSASTGERGILWKVRYRGKQVPESDARLALALLTEYCEVTGQRLTPFKNDGSPSESLKRVLGAVLSYSETEHKWRMMVSMVLANPWWNGDPSIGVVFGPKVIEDNLRNPARGSSKKAQVRSNDARAERAQRRFDRVRAAR